GSLKRGGDRRRLELPDLGIVIEAPPDDLLAIDDLLVELERDDPDGYQIVMLRYFSGLTAEETAEVLQTSLSTVKRKWRFTRAWLYRSLEGEDPDESE
ncbi:MAG: RNA polymerase subunit sigma, partial [Planctomycetes bacterium]|nr:RNA polymerase subunit sigma [Planctomycetota bacterium]